MNKEINSLSKFEQLSESSDGFLISGFSIAITTNNLVGGKPGPGLGGVNVPCTTNNCNGGNCVAGCGSPAPAPKG